MFQVNINFKIPKKQELTEALRRIAPHIHRTPLLSSAGLDDIAKCKLFFKAENLQKAGAFKSRGAVNAVFSLSEKELKKGVCTHSSGNHAQALARAAALRGTKAHIVMPDNAPKVKIDAVKHYGGLITFCRPTLKAREDTIAKVIKETGAVEIHPYDNLKVVEGQATAAMEILEDLEKPDFIVAPVGGGGLLSGTALAANYFSPQTAVTGAEPSAADDAAKSFYSKTFQPSIEPSTIADGLLTSLGRFTFPLILNLVKDILTVEEDDIAEAMRLIFQRLKIVVEPSAAVPLAAVLKNKAYFKGSRTVIILSGGNIDLQLLAKIFK